ncbi:MAG: dethiobiotin synthase [Hyphomicrobiaceae bacterium]
MTRAIVVTGTDTGIGKTVAAAALVGLLDADYWKPVQAGLSGETDRQTVMRLTGVGPERAHSEAYRLEMPASPHIAAAAQGITIDPARLAAPLTQRPLVIEGAGGLMVPLSPDLLQIDTFSSWGFPLVLCASTKLGTINHTLLSVEALHRRSMTLAGILFIGEPAPEPEATVGRISGAPRLGRLPILPDLDASTLKETARHAIDIGPIVRALRGTSGAAA